MLAQQICLESLDKHSGGFNLLHRSLSISKHGHGGWLRFGSRPEEETLVSKQHGLLAVSFVFRTFSSRKRVEIMADHIARPGQIYIYICIFMYLCIYAAITELDADRNGADFEATVKQKNANNPQRDTQNGVSPE